MSPRHLLKRYIADRESLSRSQSSGWFGKRVHDPELWHLGRRSVAGGVGLGFFLAFIPLPVQMFIAIPAAIVCRVNLPVTIAAVWITNPVTMAPMFLFAYKVGTWILGVQPVLSAAEFPPSFSTVVELFGEIGKPLLVGCLVCGISASAVGNLAVRWLWRAYLLNRRRKRRRAYRQAGSPGGSAERGGAPDS